MSASDRSSASATAVRDGADACPGLLRPFLADDGAIVRVRVPGGQLRVPDLRSLLDLASQHGAPFLQLTSRANLQLRGLTAPLPDALVQALARLAPLPSLPHERVRNIIAAPFDEDAGALARDLDAALCARPGLAQLPGRFLFAVDSPGGSAVAGEHADIVLRPGADADLVAVRHRDGGYLGRLVAVGAGVQAALEVAQSFLDERGSPRVWRTVDLASDSPVFTGLTPIRLDGPAAPAPGQHGDHLLVGIPLGLLDEGAVDALQLAAAQIGAAHVGLTPWKALTLRLHDDAGLPAALAVLEEVGLTTSRSAAHLVTACIGAPWCRRTKVRTIELARQLVALADPTTAAGPAPAPRLPVHLSGCARRCGAPRGPHTDLMPTPDTTAADLLSHWDHE